MKQTTSFHLLFIAILITSLSSGKSTKNIYKAYYKDALTGFLGKYKNFRTPVESGVNNQGSSWI